MFDVKIEAKVITVTSRIEYDELTGRKTKNWMISTTLRNNVLIFSKDAIERETTHKKQEFIELINHELVHLLYQKKHNTIKPLIEKKYRISIFCKKTRFFMKTS